MRLAALLPLSVAVIALAACGSDETAASASASATAKPPAPAPTPAPKPSASASASAEAEKLPGTPLKDVMKDVKAVMIQSPMAGAMGARVSDKKDVAALLAAIGTDQTLSKKFDKKCTTTPNLDFQTDKSVGTLGFCDPDFKTGRFDGSGASMAEITIKDPAAFKAALKKAGAIK